jgi:anti-sigma factor RsiW
MNSHLSWETLNDLVDDVLPASARNAAEGHAHACAACALALDQLRATVAAAATLPGSADPPADLWQDVRATIEARKVAPLPVSTRAPRGWWVTPRKLAVAAAALIAVTSTVTGLIVSSRMPSSIVERVRAAAVTVSWQSSERQFLESVVELRQQFELLHAQLAPETVVKVEKALSTVDLAIAEAREALVRDPANAALSELLASNYRQKIELLRRVTQLASST